MVPVVLSILLVVLMSGAVLWVVAGDLSKPTSEQATSIEPVPDAAPVAPPGPPPAPAQRPSRRPATSRRRPPTITLPAPLSVAIEPVVPEPAVRTRPAMVTTAMAGAPLPRHRARSGFLMLVLVVVVGVAVAAVLGALIVALAFALRSAVT